MYLFLESGFQRVLMFSCCRLNVNGNFGTRLLIGIIVCWSSLTRYRTTLVSVEHNVIIALLKSWTTSVTRNKNLKVLFSQQRFTYLFLCRIGILTIMNSLTLISPGIILAGYFLSMFIIFFCTKVFLRANKLASFNPPGFRAFRRVREEKP